MAILVHEGDQIKLSALDVRVLVALLVGRNSGYAVGRLIESDSGQTAEISNSPLYHSLKGLVEFGLAKREGETYAITGLGREVINAEMERLHKLVTLERERSRHRH